MRQMLRPLLATALLAVAAPVFAADQAAKANFGPQQITWEPQIAHESTVLTVSTPSGKVERHEFKGTPPTFELSTSAADGTYHWELQILPAAQPRHRRSQQGGEEPMAARAQGAIVSGSFSVAGGQIVSPDAREPRVAAQKDTPVVALDQVIPDDLIVQGSACIGLDCVNNESFGFDTIRLKENNTRIKFDDTSASAGFPANDWQLTANDSASGGSSKFSIEDITGSKVPFTVTAGAATNSIFVDSTGRVGLRTSTPVLDLHINTSNTPAVRLEQNNSGGFTAQTWDIAGNEANFFVRDVTGGSKLPFRIRPGAPTSSIDISADGDVGIGTGSPTGKLHILSSGAGTSDSKLKVENTSGTVAGREMVEVRNNGSAVWILTDTSNANASWGMASSAGSLFFDNRSDGQVEMVIDTNGNVTTSGTVNGVSSRAMKMDIEALDPKATLSRVAAMPISVWSYKTDGPGVRHLGPMSEDFYEAFGLGQDDKHISFTDSAGVALAAVQGLNQVVEEKNREISDLKSRIEALEKIVQSLTNRP